VKKQIETIRDQIVVVCVAIVFVVINAPCSGAQNTHEAEDRRPRVILLCFDGLDANLTKTLIDKGQLPALRALAEHGCFRPLQTTNPAQSPTAWASVISGKNPGKTNIPGFIRGTCDKWIVPNLATTEKSYKGIFHTVPFRSSDETVVSPASQSGHAENKTGVPREFPVPYNLHQGGYFWNLLGKEHVRFTGLFVPGIYPSFAQGSCRLLCGLGTPDVGGSTGTWYVYTDDDWVIQSQRTRTGGMIIGLEQKATKLESVVFGPVNFVEREVFESRIDELKKRIDRSENEVNQNANLNSELRKLRNSFMSSRISSLRCNPGSEFSRVKSNRTNVTC